MDVLLLALLTTLNALFAMSEMALSTSRRARLAALAETGDAGAAAALSFVFSSAMVSSAVSGRSASYCDGFKPVDSFGALFQPRSATQNMASTAAAANAPRAASRRARVRAAIATAANPMPHRIGNAASCITPTHSARPTEMPMSTTAIENSAARCHRSSGGSVSVSQR